MHGVYWGAALCRTAPRKGGSIRPIGMAEVAIDHETWNDQLTRRAVAAIRPQMAAPAHMMAHA